MRSELWDIIKVMLPQMTQLCYLIISFDEGEPNALYRWAAHIQMPVSLKMVQFNSLWYYGQMDEVG